MPKKKSLGTKIREYRKARKITQQGLGASLGVDNTTISKWEADIYQPDAEMLDKLAAKFEVSVDDLLDRNTSEESAEMINSYKEIISDPDVQFIMRSKKDLTPKQFEKMMDITRRAKEMFVDEDDN